MRGLGVLGIVSVWAALLGGCAAGTVQPRPLVNEAVLQQAGLMYQWQLPVNLQPGETVAKLWRLDENVYLLTSRSRLLAVDAVVGQLKWFYEVPGVQVFDPCHADNVSLPTIQGIKALTDASGKDMTKPFPAVIINSMSRLAVLDRTTGEVMRELDFRFPATSGGSSDGELVFLGDANGRYHGVRLADALLAWSMRSDGIVSVRPKSFAKQVYAASQDHNFGCSGPGPTGRQLRWALHTDGPLTAAFAVDGRGCFVPSEDHKLYACDPVLGHELWPAFRAKGPLKQAVQLGKNSLFQYSDGDRLYALEVATGRKRWDMPEGRWVLGTNGQNVYVLTKDHTLLVTNEVLGTVEASVPLTGLALFAHSATAPALYAATRRRRIVCIRPMGATAPLREDLLGPEGGAGAAPAPAPKAGDGATSKPAAPAEPAPAPAAP